jgi:two-component system sensor histidine kinase RpfC
MTLWQTGRTGALALLGRASPAAKRARAESEGVAGGGTPQTADLAPKPAQDVPMVHPAPAGEPGHFPRASDDGAETTMSSEAAVDQPASTAQNGGRSSPARRNCSVLLIEPNRTNQQVIGRILVRAGFEFAAVDDVAAATASNAGCDVMVVDLGAAGGRDVTAAHVLRTALPGRPRPTVLALASDPSPDFRARCKDAGFLDLICKPVKPAALIETVAAAAEAQATAQPSAAEVEDLDASTTPALEIPAIDQATLDSLERLGGADFVDELASQFMDDAATTLAELASVVEAADVQAFREHAHALRSAAANIGALGMYEMCLDWRDIEPAALAANGKQIIVSLTNEFERVSATLKQVQSARLQRAAS